MDKLSVVSEKDLASEIMRRFTVFGKRFDSEDVSMAYLIGVSDCLLSVGLDKDDVIALMTLAFINDLNSDDCSENPLN